MEENYESIAALFKAIRGGKVRQVTSLLESGLDPNTRDDALLTPLMHAINIQKDDVRTHVVRLLLSKNCDVNAQDADGRTALMIAAFENKRDDVVRRIIATGQCEVNLVDRKGETALMYAVYGNNEGVIRILVNSSHTKMCIDVDKRNKDGINPLLLAYRLRHAGCCRVLLEEGQADINAVRDRGGLMEMLTREHGDMNYPPPPSHDTLFSNNKTLPASWRQMRRADMLSEDEEFPGNRKPRKGRKKRKRDRMSSLTATGVQNTPLNPLAISPTAMRNVTESELYLNTPRGIGYDRAMKLSPLRYQGDVQADPGMLRNGLRENRSQKRKKLHRHDPLYGEDMAGSLAYGSRLSPIRPLTPKDEYDDEDEYLGNSTTLTLPCITPNTGRINLISSPQIIRRN